MCATTIYFSKWSNSIFEFTLENILAYLDFFLLVHTNRKDLEPQEYQPTRFRNIWITLVIILDPAFFVWNSAHVLHFWNQYNSQDIPVEQLELNLKYRYVNFNFGKFEVLVLLNGTILGDLLHIYSLGSFYEFPSQMV